MDTVAPIEHPTDAEVLAVAKAMDIDLRLDWVSTDHDKVDACHTALLVAEQMIVGMRAVRMVEGGANRLPGGRMSAGNRPMRGTHEPAPPPDHPPPDDHPPPEQEPAPPAMATTTPAEPGA